MNRIIARSMLCVGLAASICGQSSWATDLPSEQKLLADRYARLKASALRIAESLDENAQTRAKQIRAAIGQSQQFEIEERFTQLVEQLERQRLSAAMEGQTEIARRLEDLLRVMVEDPREAELEANRARLERLSKEIDALIRKQRALRIAAGADTAQREGVVGRQSQLADQTQRLAESPDAQQTDTPETGPGPSLSDRLQSANGRMRAAAHELGSGDGKQAAEEQLRAQQELEAAQRAIDEALNQLREEQLQRRLVGLIDRLRAMHAGETGLLQSTVALHTKHEGDPASRGAEIGVAALIEAQQRVSDEASRALRVVRADGQSMVFADALEQVAYDMGSVLRRLDERKIAQGTQALQQSVIDSLLLMIDAVRQSLNDLEQQQQSREQSAGQGAMSPGLVAQLAELRMLRAVQTRILQQTKLWNDLSGTEGQDPEEVRQELKRLAREQHRLAEAAVHASSPP